MHVFERKYYIELMIIQQKDFFQKHHIHHLNHCWMDLKLHLHYSWQNCLAWKKHSLQIFAQLIKFIQAIKLTVWKFQYLKPDDWDPELSLVVGSVSSSSFSWWILCFLNSSSSIFKFVSSIWTSSNLPTK